jgi:hypothetical protein
MRRAGCHSPLACPSPVCQCFLPAPASAAAAALSVRSRRRSSLRVSSVKYRPHTGAPPCLGGGWPRPTHGPSAPAPPESCFLPESNQALLLQARPPRATLIPRCGAAGAYSKGARRVTQACAGTGGQNEVKRGGQTLGGARRAARSAEGGPARGRVGALQAIHRGQRRRRLQGARGQPNGSLSAVGGGAGPGGWARWRGPAAQRARGASPRGRRKGRGGCVGVGLGGGVPAAGASRGETRVPRGWGHRNICLPLLLLLRAHAGGRWTSGITGPAAACHAGRCAGSGWCF